MTTLSGKTALVTGASRGIGRAAALALAEGGAQVLIHYGQGKAEAEAVVAEIRTAGGRASAVAADLAVPDGPHELASQVREIVGERLDVLIANAGISKSASLEDTTVEDFDRLFAVNVRSPFFLVQQTLPILGNGSSVVFVSSLGAHAVVGTLAAYSATKGSLRQALAGAKHPIFYLAIPPTNFEVVVEQLGKSGCSNGCASLSKNLSVAMGLLPGNSTASCSELLKKGPSSVWTIFLARVRCITWCTSVSGMQCLNPCGIATMSRVSRSRWRRTLESRAGRVL
jgi:NADP-dependent 3-hydroxy acid dehydrogenase YdfG